MITNYLNMQWNLAMLGVVVSWFPFEDVAVIKPSNTDIKTCLLVDNRKPNWSLATTTCPNDTHWDPPPPPQMQGK